MAPGGEERETVMVGMRMDADGRELLTWALVKVAEPGDQVIALHVLPASPAAHLTDSDSRSASCLSLISLISSFDSVLAAYEGFCSLKQIDLKLKICRGSSLRKVLVSEVNTFAATKLVLGASKNSRAIGSSISVAKYCAKKVPRDCSVHVVDNGKIMFQKEAIRLRPTDAELRSPGCCSPRTSFQAHHISSKNLNSTYQMNASPEPSSRGDGEKHNTSSMGFPLHLHGRADFGESKPVAESARAELELQSIQAKKDYSKAIVRTPRRQSSFSFIAKGLGESGPGWSLLRKTFLHDKRTASEKSKISVVQWAMSFPSRYSSPSSTPAHPVRGQPRVAVKAPPNFHINAGAIVPLGDDELHPPDAVQQQNKSRKHPKELDSLQLKYSSTCRLFSYNELMSATNNFSAEKMVGKGGSSRVYKGCLPDGKEIAVKILRQSEDVCREFAQEVEIITALRHKNIISLLGFCFESDNFVLVYNFLTKGCLEDNLHGVVKGKPSIGWAERYKVAMGVAEALNYLHGAGAAQSVIHRDVKSSNILLSDDFEPQLSDFGIAKWASSTSSNLTCNDVAGTFGYLAPEYFMYGKVNEKIDVYAFGVVLLELLTGRKPIQNTECSKGQESLIMWAKPILESGKLMQLLDPSFGDDVDLAQAERTTLAASLCIRRSPRSRPMMALVLKLLQGDEDVIKWAKLQSGAPQELDGLDDDSASPAATLQSHLSLALLDVEDDSLSDSSTDNIAEQIMSHGSLEDYLKGRWSRSSSFN